MLTKQFNLFAILLGGMLVAQPAFSDAQRSLFPHGAVELVLSGPLASGRPAKIGAHFNLEPGWHIYWKNPGDTGLPTEIAWQSSNGVIVGPPNFPAPQRIPYEDMVNFGYEGESLLTSTIEVQKSKQPQEVSAKLNFVICKDECIPVAADLSLNLKSSNQAVKSALFAKLGTEVAAAAEVLAPTVSYNEREIKLFFPKTANSSLRGGQLFFFPDVAGQINNAAPQITAVTEDRGSVLILSRLDSKEPLPETLSGVISVTDGSGKKTLLSATIAAKPIAEGLAVNSYPAEQASLLYPILFAMLGGLILNLMPCVFPVISIKILSFVNHSGTRAARIHGLMFAAGVVVSFWVLAAMLLGLRAGGAELGWGFQFQSPLFVAAMAMLLFVLGLSLLGVFEIGSKVQNVAGRVQTGDGYSGSFMSGALATLLSTPCTAPFMGSALAAAMSMPIAQAFTIFTALGVGMALPYVILSAVPALMKYMPRPGNWMIAFKQAMAFPMFATDIWLIWVLGQQAGIDAAAKLLLGLLTLSIGFWLYGRWAAPHCSRKWRRLGFASAASFVVLAGLVGMPARELFQSEAQASANLDEIQWEPFSEARVKELMAQHKPILINFTAAWCLSCQMNHRMVYDCPDLAAKLREKKVVTLRADWTSKNPEISRALESRGRNGVPLDVFYNGEAKEPTIFPALLTKSALLEAVDGIKN